MALYRMIVTEVVANEVAYYVEAESAEQAEEMIDEADTIAEVFLRTDRVVDRAFHRETLAPMKGDAAYMNVALANGWDVSDDDPDPQGNRGDGDQITGPVLYNAGLDRVWPLNDWRGACGDIGLLD